MLFTSELPERVPHFLLFRQKGPNPIHQITDSPCCGFGRARPKRCSVYVQDGGSALMKGILDLAIVQAELAAEADHLFRNWTSLTG